MTDASIPVIDIAPFLQGSPDDKLNVAQQVAQACETIGFLNIVGHGVAPDLIAAMYAVSQAFFDLPATEKLKSAMPTGIYRGYAAIGAETLSYSLGHASPPDLRESFIIGPVQVPDQPYYHTPEAGSSFAANIWPDQPESFKPIWTDYYTTMADLAATLMRIFAIALQLPELFFADKIDKAMSCLTVRHYPEQPQPPLPEQLRTSAHSDYGSLSILHQDGAPGGLQVLGRDKIWRDVPSAPDSFIVNLGDVMARWTNDRWVSTLHRVVNPPANACHTRRLSIPFFHNPNYDALITCLESCCSPDYPPKYPPITAGEHIWRKTMQHIQPLQPQASVSVVPTV